MKRRRAIIAAMLSAAMVMGMAGCGNSGESPSGKTIEESTQTDAKSEQGQDDEKTTINIRLMNDVVNVDKVLDVFYEETKDDPVLSKIKVNITYVSGADYTDKLTLAVTAQENYDLMFCGGWQGLDGYIEDGSFKDLTSYFNNDDYPGLKESFSGDFLSANEVNGKVYYIPLASCLDDLRGIAYREDLREKYGCPEITDWDTFETYLKALKENEEDAGIVVPWGVSSLQGFRQLMNADYYTAKKNGILEYETTGIPMYASVSADGKTVNGVVTYGDDDSLFAAFPEGYQTNYLDAEVEKFPYWLENYCNTDCVSSKDDTSSMFEAGMYGATYSTLTEWVAHVQNMETSLPEAKLGFFVVNDDQRAMKDGAIASDMKCFNTLVVPQWSDKTDKVMAFLNWMWGSKENHDLMTYGIEGEDWEAIGDNAYKLLPIDESEKYSMPEYTFPANPNYVRYSDVVLENEMAEKYMDYQFSDEAYSLVPVSGFTFDTTNVESEVATLSALWSDFKGPWGVYGDETEAKLKQLNEDCKNAGLEKVREEFKNQLQAYLDQQ